MKTLFKEKEKKTVVNLGEKIQEENDTENKFALKLHVHMFRSIQNRIKESLS